MLEPQYYTIKNFKFKSGEILADLKMEYATFGNKKTDSNGNITNGIVYLHGSSGDYSSVKRVKDILGPGKVIDTNDYFVICPTSLGNPGSSSPSTSGMGHLFPKYTVEDMVDAVYNLLTQKLNIKHLKGIIGTSMGGFLVLQWAINYPDFMEFIIPITTSSTSKGQNYAISTIMNNYIKNDPDYRDGKYEHKPLIGPQNAMMLLYLFGFSPAYYKTSSNKEVLESIHEMEVEGANSDANDIVWQNEATINYDVRAELHKIKANTLIIGVNQDQYFPPDVDVIPLSKAIKGSKLFLYDSLLGHLGSSEIEQAKEIIGDFLKLSNATRLVHKKSEIF